MKRALEMDGGDGCPVMRACSMPPNGTPDNGSDATIHDGCILPQ